MANSIEYASFLVRLWREKSIEEPAPPGGWHSVVEHIQTGERYDFDTLEELLDFLRQNASGREAWPDAIP